MTDFRPHYSELQTRLNRFATIRLEDMTSVRLLNRIDTKYLTTFEKLLELLDLAKEEYMVQVIDGKRNLPYYTMYLDTDDCHMYTEHHRGKKCRKKIRIRRYESTMLSFLEIKSKNNRGRTQKKRVKCNIDEIMLHRDFINLHTPYSIESLKRRIENRFNRITLVNREMSERLTIDTRLRFHNLCSGNRVMLSEIVIIELKRNGNIPSPVTGMLGRLQIRPCGFSKYCIGMAITDHRLKQNRFKERIRFMERNTTIVRDNEAWPD
ncbi:MAG: polyphosphate polymerase domain-containing protein [Muribaculaceae bacterium]|nr:polyphosphate polymerase domain-containing protein [Muribaculaceae bacterium]